MKDFGTFDIRLKVISPIHIGCGEDFEPTNMVIADNDDNVIPRAIHNCCGEDFEPTNMVIADNGNLAAFDFLKLSERLDHDEREELGKICMNDDLLQVFRKIRKIYLAKRSAVSYREVVPVAQEIVNKYKEIMNGAERMTPEQLINKFRIARTSFSPNSARPYIPGSSVKGALRTAWISKLAQDKRKTISTPSSDVSRDKNASKLEEELMQGTFAEDPFRMVKVSDFYAAGKVNRRIVYAVNRKKRVDSNSAPKGIPVMLETIQEESVFTGTISILKPPNGANIRQPVTAELLRKATNQFYLKRLKVENETLVNMNITNQAVALYDKEYMDSNPISPWMLLRIGHHSGAESVTLESNRSIMIKGVGKAKSYKDHATTIWLASEKARPETNDELKQFGWVLAEVIE